MSRWCCPQCKCHLGGLSLVNASERATIANGLRIAVAQFEEDARTAHDNMQPRVAQQFEQQARETQHLIEEFES